MKKLLFLIALISSNLVSAQDLSPWNSYFIVSAKGYTDTVWFGCDTAGGIGYQEGLDILDTSDFAKPIKIISYDSIIQQELGTGTCGNLYKPVGWFK